MTQAITNNAVTTLAADMNATQNTMNVLSAAKFPLAGAAAYTILVDAEYMLVTGGMGTTTWTVTRGVEGSTPTTHNGSSNPATVQLELTAGLLEALADGGPNSNWKFLRPSGLVGATAISRYVGATAGGPPGSGTFSQGDWVIDFATPAVLVCISPGSPGVWQAAISLATGLGRLTYATITTGGGVVGTTTVALANYSLTGTVLANRLIEIRAVFQWGNNSSINNVVHTLFRDGVSTTQQMSAQLATANQNVTAFEFSWLDVAPSAGSHTWSIQAVTNLGTANNSVQSGFPGMMIVEDKGPS